MSLLCLASILVTATKVKSNGARNQKEKLTQNGANKMSLYRNIHAKRKRIKAGSKEKMRKVGSKGAPTANAFKQSAKTAKKKKKTRR